jgi:hypothetical protein
MPASFPNSQDPIFDKYPPNNAFTIPAIIKLFSVNVNFSQCQLLTMSKVLRICLTLLLAACPEALSSALCLSRAKLLGIVFPTSIVRISKNF